MKKIGFLSLLAILALAVLPVFPGRYYRDRYGVCPGQYQVSRFGEGLEGAVGPPLSNISFPSSPEFPGGLLPRRPV